MKFETKLKEFMQTAVGKYFKNAKEMADKTGINQGALSEFLRGKKQTMTIATAGKILDTVGAELFFPDNAEGIPAQEAAEAFPALQSKILLLQEQKTMLITANDALKEANFALKEVIAVQKKEIARVKKLKK